MLPKRETSNNETNKDDNESIGRLHLGAQALGPSENGENIRAIKNNK